MRVPSEPSAVGIATDLTLILPDRVGSLAQAMAALARAGVNIEGHGGFPAWAGEGVLHLIVDDADAARVALAEAGIEVRDERPVLTVLLEDRPGSFAGVLGDVAAAGVNVDLTYAIGNRGVVIGVNDVQKARRAIEGNARAS